MAQRGRGRRGLERENVMNFDIREENYLLMGNDELMIPTNKISIIEMKLIE